MCFVDVKPGHKQKTTRIADGFNSMQQEYRLTEYFDKLYGKVQFFSGHLMIRVKRDRSIVLRGDCSRAPANDARNKKPRNRNGSEVFRS